MKRKVVYPGTFDPITKGHMDIIERASKMYDEVTVAVAEGVQKNPLFSTEERIDMIKHVVKNLKGVKVESYGGLLVEYMKKSKKRLVIRGLRAISDFEYEFQLALLNKKMMGDDIELIYMMPDEKYLYISSSAVKEIAGHFGDVKEFVHPYVAGKIKAKYKK
ncbi:MAG: pantetheine-phosphate adenylyltransferase [bacterium]